jgi:hypothetical protein
LLFGLCNFVWVIKLLVNHPNPHPRAPTHPSTLEVLWTRERTLTLSPSVISTFGFTIEWRNWGAWGCVMKTLLEWRKLWSSNMKYGSWTKFNWSILKIRTNDYKTIWFVWNLIWKIKKCNVWKQRKKFK